MPRWPSFPGFRRISRECRYGQVAKYRDSRDLETSDAQPLSLACARRSALLAHAEGLHPRRQGRGRHAQEPSCPLLTGHLPTAFLQGALEIAPLDALEI